MCTLANDYNGLKVVVDCANGSASATAPTLFEKLNVNAKIIFDFAFYLLLILYIIKISRYLNI